MQVLLYEWVIGGGARRSAMFDKDGIELSNSLLPEARAMLTALAEDFSRIDGVAVRVLRASEFEAIEFPGCETIEVRPSEACDVALLRREAAKADWTLVIAPECGGTLLDRCRQVIEAGGKLLGPSQAFVELAGDKHATVEFLRSCGVPVPTGRALAAGEPIPADFPRPAVLKPRDGAGSIGVQRLGGGCGSECAASGQPAANATACDPTSSEPSGNSQANGCCSISNECGDVSEGAIPTVAAWPARLERFHAGIAVSVAVIAGPNSTLVLPACTQRFQRSFANGGSFEYAGGMCPLPSHLAIRAHRLVRQAAQALAPLSPLGYFGMDLILGADPEGRDDVLIEVNPRLTTSYVGLRRAVRNNLAALMLAAATGEGLRITPIFTSVEFDADGSVRAG